MALRHQLWLDLPLSTKHGDRTEMPVNSGMYGVGGNARFVYGLPQSSKQLVSIRVQTRLYIRPLVGDAISWPSMYAHSGSSKGQWAL